MEEGSPVLEAFTESVGDGPSQPLMRKLMSMIWTPEAPRQDPDISGFFLVEPPASLSFAGSSSRQVPLEITEDIAQTVGCPVEDMETVVQSGFRFAGAEGCCDSPRAENYFTESSLPADLADKVPIDFLHAINNVLDTKVYPTPRTHHHGRRRNARRTRAPPAFMRNREQEFFGPQAEFASSSTAETNYGQEMIMRRLDRLEEICLRTESYVHVVLGTMDKRLQLLEADGLRSTQDSACSPTFPGPDGLFFSEADTFEAGTFVTPEMLVVHRPGTTGAAVLQVPDADEAQVAAMCLSPIDALPSPALILTGSPSEAFRTSQSAFSCAAAAAAQEVFSARAGLDELSAAMAPPTRNEETTSAEESADRPQISAVAVFSLAPDAVAGASYENPVDALLCDPVVTWENDGFPYLRPAYQMDTAPSPPLRDTTVLTWEAARYLSPDSSSRSSEDDRPTPDDAFSFYNMEEPAREEPSASQHPRHEACRRKEDSMLDEISSILKNICNNLEVLRTPEQSAGNAASTSGSCPRCYGDRGSERPATLIQEMMACKDQEEIISVLEGMFTRLAFLPQPEDVLVNMLPTMEADSSTGSASPPAVPDSPPGEVVIEGVKPQNAAADQTPEIHPQDAGTGPKVSLSFIQEDFSKAAEASSLSQDMHVEIDAASTEPVTFHIAIAPKEMTVTRDAEESNTEDIASSIVEDICVSVEGPYQLMVVNEYTREELPPEDREAVTVSKDKVQLTGDVVADYTLKVVPRSQHEGQDAAGSSAETNVEEKTLVDNEAAVSSVIHELCFSMEAPRTDAAGGEAPELPLQIGIAVTADPKTDTGLVVRDSPGSTSSDQEEPKEIAAIVLNLEGLQKTEGKKTAAGVSCCSKPGCTRAVLTSSSLENYAVAEPDEDDREENRPLSFNWEGVPCSGECEDIPCLIEEADRKVLGKDEVASVHQEVCISVEVPNATMDNDEAGSSGVHIGVSVRAVPEHSSSNELISCVEIPPEQEFEKIPFTEVTYVVEQPKEDELQPLNKPSSEQTTDEIKNLSEDESVESIVGPPPSPTEESPETHDYLFKEEKKPGPENEWMIESIFLPKESFQQVQAKVPKLVLKGMTPMDLVRGSLHFDGKACLLSVSIDEIWTAEDMCQAPVSTAAVFAKHKSLLDPVIPSPVRKKAAEDVSFRDMPAWLGDVLADVGGDKVQAFGFRCASRRQQQAETFKGAMTLGFGLQQQFFQCLDSGACLGRQCSSRSSLRLDFEAWSISHLWLPQW